MIREKMESLDREMSQLFKEFWLCKDENKKKEIANEIQNTRNKMYNLLNKKFNLDSNP